MFSLFVISVMNRMTFHVFMNEHLFDTLHLFACPNFFVVKKFFDKYFISVFTLANYSKIRYTKFDSCLLVFEENSTFYI